MMKLGIDVIYSNLNDRQFKRRDNVKKEPRILSMSQCERTRNMSRSACRENMGKLQTCLFRELRWWTLMMCDG